MMKDRPMGGMERDAVGSCWENGQRQCLLMECREQREHYHWRWWEVVMGGDIIVAPFTHHREVLVGEGVRGISNRPHPQLITPQPLHISVHELTLPLAAFAKVVPNQAKARQEGSSEQAYPPMVPSED